MASIVIKVERFDSVVKEYVLNGDDDLLKIIIDILDIDFDFIRKSVERKKGVIR